MNGTQIRQLADHRKQTILINEKHENISFPYFGGSSF